MNLRDLHYLVSVADHLHFGRAALACHVSQPTLSMQLKKLEDTLGVQLFERTNKQVMLTAIGADIAERARRTLAEAEQIRATARAAQDPMAGDVRLGIFPTLAPYFLPRLMPHLTQQFPRLNLLLVEEKTPLLLEQLGNGTLDCALLAMPAGGDTLTAHRLFTEPFQIAVNRSHPLARRKQVSLADLQHETMLLLEDGHCLRDQALEVCHTLGIGESNNFRATSLETLRHMVASGNAVTLMPALAIQPKDPHVAYIPFKAHAPSRMIGLYYRTTSARAPLFTKLSASIAGLMKAL